MGYMDSYRPGACGHQVREGALFCPVCGRPAREEGTAGQLDTVDCASPATTRPPPPGPPPRKGRTWRQASAVVAVAVLAGGGAAAAVVALHRPAPATALAKSSPAGGTSRPATTVPSETGPSETGPAATGPTGSGLAGAGPAAASAVAPPAAASSATALPASPGEQAAAEQVGALLAQSVTDRGAVVQAVSDVNGCGPDLAGDAQTFSQAASSRASLVGQLAGVPDAAALPSGLLADLSGAWQASAAADRDFAGWARDELANGCTPDDSADPDYQAASGPDNAATADKQAFAAAWNPVATRYGLTRYQWNEL